MRRTVIVGNGMAGARLAEDLCRRDPDGTRVSITVVGDEPQPAYNRILLSTVLAGGLTPQDTRLHPTGWYESRGIAARLGVTVTEIDPDTQTVLLSDGSPVGYDELVLATGSSPFLPPVAGLLDAGGDLAADVVPFRTVEDCTAIIAAVRSGTRVVVLGGGVLGLEAARGLLIRGAHVTVVHPVDFPMDRQLDPPGAAVLTRVLRSLGLTLLLGRFATMLTTDRPGARHLILDDGTEVPVDLVVLTAGIRPRIELARAAGLLIGKGIVVDDRMHTSAAHVWAIGECAQHGGIVYGLVQPAWDQAAVAANHLTGTDTSARYRGSTPITRLKAHGIDLASMGEVRTDLDSSDAEVLAIADPTRGRYAKVVVRDGRLVGAVTLGNPDVVGTLTQLFDTRAPVPADRMSLLLGRAPPEVDPRPAHLTAAAIVCRCNSVTKQHLTAAFRAGARTPAALAAKTRAGTGCGECRHLVEGYCRHLNDGTTVALPSSGPVSS
ncbi:FAD-dependent oxidoreductase [Rhodococcus olei]|uniref:FAD-dependent oxidoreductase n=1 Tax=Rhodococcus olei TaxID=2161675 RepID=A0ABP8NYF3_9NOCA